MFNLSLVEAIENTISSIFNVGGKALEKSAATYEDRTEERKLRKQAAKKAKEIKKILEDM